MRIIAVRTLRDFWTQPGRGDSESPLRASDVKQMFRTADILPKDRIVFNIGGNKYRLVVAVHYRGKRAFVRFIGTHTEYDRIDATRV